MTEVQIERERGKEKEACGQQQQKAESLSNIKYFALNCWRLALLLLPVVVASCCWLLLLPVVVVDASAVCLRFSAYAHIVFSCVYLMFAYWHRSSVTFYDVAFECEFEMNLCLYCLADIVANRKSRKKKWRTCK